jgi:G3E family GTPase
MAKQIPVTVITGFLGSGKTTIIINLIEQLPQDYKVVWLKNEYGDKNIDKVLAAESNIRTAEMLNGCLCCVLVGKLGNALKEIIETQNPDRIIIETSGTAYPAPVVWEIEKIPELQLDGVITVIDAVNFAGYRDKSVAAKLQTKYTDLIVINKTSLVNPEELDQRLDDVYELNALTPKIKTADGVIDKDLLLGIDSKLVINPEDLEFTKTGEIEVHDDEVETFAFETDQVMNKSQLDQLLKGLDSEYFYRIKGVVQTTKGKYELLNYVQGRIDWQQLHKYQGDTVVTFMGKNILKSQTDLITRLGQLN